MRLGPRCGEGDYGTALQRKDRWRRPIRKWRRTPTHVLVNKRPLRFCAHLRPTSRGSILFLRNHCRAQAPQTGKHLNDSASRNSSIDGDQSVGRPASFNEAISDQNANPSASKRRISPGKTGLLVTSRPCIRSEKSTPPCKPWPSHCTMLTIFDAPSRNDFAPVRARSCRFGQMIRNPASERRARREIALPVRCIAGCQIAPGAAHHYSTGGTTIRALLPSARGR